MAGSSPDYSDLNSTLLKNALAHIASGGSISLQGPQPGGSAGPAPGGPQSGSMLMPPPPPPPPANFHDFSMRPENAAAIQGALNTKPNQPTVFNQPPAPGPPSIFSPTENPMPMPTTVPSAPIAAAAAMPAGAGASTPALPDLPNAPTPLVNPGLMTQDEYFAAHPEMLAHPQASTPMGKALLFLTAGLTGAAGGLHGDPGAGVRYAQGVADYNRGVTDVNQQRYEAGAVKPFQQNLANQDTQSQIQQRGAAAELDKAKTAQIPAKAQQELAQHGLKQVQNDDGTTSTVVDPDSPVAKKQQAQTDFITSHKELEDAQAALAKVKADPKSQQFQLAQRRVQIAAQNAQTAAKGLGLRGLLYDMHAYGTDGQGNALPGALLLDDGTPVGSVQASNVRPTAVQRDAAGRATTMDALAEKLRAGLQDPEIQAHLGPIAGRLAEAQNKIGNLPPKVAEFYNDMKSYGAFQAGLHPVKGIGALNYFDDVMGGLHQTPEQLGAKLTSNTNTGASVEGVGSPRVAGGRPQQASNSPMSGRKPGAKKADFLYVPGKGLVAQ